MAILAAALGILSMVFWAAGLILDTVSKYHNEVFHVMKKIQMRPLRSNALTAEKTGMNFHDETKGTDASTDTSSFNFS